MKKTIPQGLKPSVFCGVRGTTKQAAEKGMVSDDVSQEHPSAAKAGVDFMPFSARLKSCPFKASSFSAACNVKLFQSSEMRSFNGPGQGRNA